MPQKFFNRKLDLHGELADGVVASKVSQSAKSSGLLKEAGPSSRKIITNAQMAGTGTLSNVFKTYVNKSERS